MALFWLLPIGIAISTWIKSSQIEELRRQQALRAAEARAAAMPLAPPPEVPKPYLESAREMLRERELTATLAEALTALETAAMPGVSVSVIEMLPAERAIRVSVLLDKAADPVAYLDMLNEGNAGDPTAATWKLLQIQANSEGGMVATIVFARPS